MGQVRAFAAVLVGMLSENARTARPSSRVTAPAPASDSPTWPPLSSNRAEGVVWSERLLAQTHCASGDAARFAAGLSL